MYQWQEEVLSSGEKEKIVRVCRRGGKTALLLEWAKRTEGNVMILCKNRISASIMYQTFIGSYEDEILGYSRNGFNAFHKNRQIVFAHSGSEVSYRGMGFDNLGIDDAEFVDKEDLSRISRVRGQADILITSTRGDSEGSALNTLLSVTPGFTHVYDYLDMVQERGEEYREFLREIMLDSSGISFEEEMGPWKKPSEKENIDYVQLLKT